MDFRKIILAIVVGLMLLSIPSCDEKVCTDCEFQSYDFRDSISVEPNTEVINQGDTIWMSCKFEKNHLDSKTNAMVLFEAVRIGQIITFQRLISKNNTTEGLKDFDIYFENGKKFVTHQEDQDLGFDYANEASSYHFRIGIVPKKDIAKGIYYIFAHQTGDLKNKKGDAANFNLSFKVKDQHLNLYYDNITNAPIAPQFEKTVYCFGVAE